MHAAFQLALKRCISLRSSILLLPKKCCLFSKISLIALNDAQNYNSKNYKENEKVLHFRQLFLQENS